MEEDKYERRKIIAFSRFLRSYFISLRSIISIAYRTINHFFVLNKVIGAKKTNRTLFQQQQDL